MQSSSTPPASSSKGRPRTSGGVATGRLFTPSLDLGILAGITRGVLLELADSVGYQVEEGHFALDDLRDADEAFTSSSVREVMPVTELDGRALARGPAADELQAALRRSAEATLP